MSFFDIYETLHDNELSGIVDSVTEYDVEAVLGKETLGYHDFLCLLSTAAEAYLEPMAIRARKLTRHHFGKVMQLYVPLYLSNECTNSCRYCGFSKDTSLERKTLSLDEMKQEMVFLRDRGFQNILLLTGEAEALIGDEYIISAIECAREYFPSVSLEIYPVSEERYRRFVEAGACGLTIYQETYHRESYLDFHPAGPKRNFAWRLEAPGRALQAGFRKVGLGALLGLYEWRYEAALLGLHAEFLMKRNWRNELIIAFPRYRDMGKNFITEYPVSDKHLVQMILAMRLFLPWAGLVLSTRESPELRDNLMSIGITQMSAESRTNPGGYSQCRDSGEQFTVADTRSLERMMAVLKEKGYDPVLKDWAYDFEGIEKQCK